MIETIFCLRSMILSPAENYSLTVRKQMQTKEKCFCVVVMLFCVFWYFFTGILKVFNSIIYIA